MRDEGIERKELGRGYTRQTEGIEDREDKLDGEEEETRLGQIKRKGKETHDEKNTEKEKGRSNDKGKENDRRDFLASERSPSLKRAQSDTPVTNNGPSPRKARNEKRKE